MKRVNWYLVMVLFSHLSASDNKDKGFEFYIKNGTQERFVVTKYVFQDCAPCHYHYCSPEMIKKGRADKGHGKYFFGLYQQAEGRRGCNYIYAVKLTHDTLLSIKENPAHEPPYMVEQKEISPARRKKLDQIIDARKQGKKQNSAE